MSILATDPGQERSGVVVISNDGVVTLADGSMRNDELLNHLCINIYDAVVCEIMSAIRQSVGLDTFETCYQIGRIQQVCGGKFVGIEARQVKRHMIGTVTGKPSLVREAIIKRYSYGTTDKAAAKKIACGTSKHPGPLYGVCDHAWSALAVAICYLDQTKEIKLTKKEAT